MTGFFQDAGRLALCFALTTLCTDNAFAEKKTLNTASPDKHPYAALDGGRENHRYTDERVNEARLYEFYQRQADYYLAVDSTAIPEILPAYPGLDGGKHGHWGKHNQNQYEDGRWNEIDFGSVITHVTRTKDLVVLKGINVRLPDGHMACFDPLRLTYAAFWKGGVKFHPFRWGTSRNAEIDGEILSIDKDGKREGKYLGFYRRGEDVIFHMEIDGKEVFEQPAVKNGKLAQVVPSDIEGLKKGSNPAWEKTVSTVGELGPETDSAYRVDTLTVPYQNPFRSVMQLSGIAFDPAGTAYVTTLCGEVWTVKGIDEELRNLQWRRFASGLNQPVGIHIDDEGIFVLDRGQIYRLHDRNDDGEADYYENYANDFGGYDRSHSHTFGLHRTADGAFHFTQRESILRTGPDRKTADQGWGVRNCMGIGGSDDFFWVGPQEGTWTPATSIIEVNQGEFYGLPKAGRGGNIAAPLCFIPRGVDNSVGGFVEVTSDRWGPFQGKHIGLSYGSAVHYLVLRDDTGARPQGGVVPMEGDFLAGSMRGAFNPKDGQLYVVGLDGWGDYSVKDGCFHRVQYTGEKVYQPCGFRVHSNGILVDFTEPLGEASFDAKKIFAQVWNYEYAKRYGSPEFSTKHPASLGHDRLEVASVTRIDENSLFVELPDLEPVMQLHLRMHLTGADGHAFKTDLFCSPMYPSAHLEHAGLRPPVEGKPTAIALRIAAPEPNVPAESGTKLEGARELLVEAIGGLQYRQKRLEVKAGEPLALRLKNTDVMPHNLVLVAPGSERKIGEASFKMLNDPDAGRKHYVPDFPEVLAFVPVISPSKEHVLHFKAPAEPGEYRYICTFPGHWQVMQGVLVVK